MAPRLFEKWFNVAPWPNARCVLAAGGEKFWLLWLPRFEHALELHVCYRGKWVGVVNTLLGDDGTLTLADILIFARYKLRGLGLGAAMMREVMRWSRSHEVKRIWGFIQPHDGSTLRFLIEWYSRHGFEVFEAKPGWYQIFMEIR